jgi:drug/metabolite transporter (DMT)-like permease
MQSRPHLYNWLIFATLALIWGTSYILIKRGLVVFTPIQVAALRLGISCMCCLPFLPQAIRDIPRSQYLRVLLVGLIGSGIPAFLFAYAMTHINSSVNGIINSLSPLFTVLTGALIWRIVTPPFKLFGVLIGLVGAGVLVFGKHGLVLDGDMLYALLPITATLCYGINTNYVKRYFATTPALSVTALAMAMMGIPVWCILLSTDIGTRIQLPGAWACIGYVSILALFGTVIGWILFYKLIQRTDALFGASVTYIIPVVAIAWGLYDGEQIAVYQFVGLGLILTGVYFVSRYQPKAVAV